MEEENITFVEYESFYYSISLKNNLSLLIIDLESIFLDNFDPQRLTDHLKSIFSQAQSIKITNGLIDKRRNEKEMNNLTRLSLQFNYNSLNGIKISADLISFICNFFILDDLKDKLSRLNLYCFSLIFKELQQVNPSSSCDQFTMARLDPLENVFIKMETNRLVTITSLTVKDPERFLILKRFLQVSIDFSILIFVFFPGIFF